MIDPATQAEVLRLFFTEKLSQRQIASRFQVHRRTVAALILRRSVQLERSEGGCRVSLLAPYHERIEALLRDEPSRSAVNILQTLRQAGYLGGITILKDYLRTRRPKSEPKAYLSLEFLPGQAAQVDWGDFGDVFGLGRKVWCFVMVHCWSRLLYVEFTHSANFESFLRCHENAFRFFGGVAREIWYDNLASAVTERLQKLIRFNYRFLAYSGFYGFKPVACNPASGHEKGRVERLVRDARSFLYGKDFKSMIDLNQQFHGWFGTRNRIVHRSTQKTPLELLARERLLIAPKQPYPARRVVPAVLVSKTAWAEFFNQAE